MHKLVVIVGYLALLATLLGATTGEMPIRRACRGLLAGIIVGASLFVLGTFLVSVPEFRHTNIIWNESLGVLMAFFWLVVAIFAASMVIGVPIWLWLLSIGRAGLADAVLLGLLLACGCLLGFGFYVWPSTSARFVYLTWPFITAIAGGVAGMVAWNVMYGKAAQGKT